MGSTLCPPDCHTKSAEYLPSASRLSKSYLNIEFKPRDRLSHVTPRGLDSLINELPCVLAVLTLIPVGSSSVPVWTDTLRPNSRDRASEIIQMSSKGLCRTPRTGEHSSTRLSHQRFHTLQMTFRPVYPAISHLVR